MSSKLRPAASTPQIASVMPPMIITTAPSAKPQKTSLCLPELISLSNSSGPVMPPVAVPIA